ncbi:MAG: sugar phosphate isomerase/epimerase [Planctomycetaceae bacterium]|nr:sugar phosphate isomerase/epimerase [Planctomycetaceae bacterium]
MKYAICNETFLDWPFDRACAAAREYGYTGIEIAPFTLAADARQISAEQRRTVRRQAAAADLEVVGLHWLLAKTTGYHLTTPDAGVRKATAEYLRELARLCRELGGSVLVFGSPQQRNILPGVTPEQAVDHAVEVFTTALPTLEECDVVLALEPLGPAEGNFLNTAESAAQLIERIGSPNCRLHLDTKAMSTEASPIPEIIARYADLLEHFHTNDPNKQGPGFGDLDFVPILAALEEVGYDGWLSVEVFDYTPGPEVLAQKSIDYLQDCARRLAL